MMEILGGVWVYTLFILTAVTYTSLFGYMFFTMTKWWKPWMKDKFLNMWIWPAGCVFIMFILSLVFAGIGL